MWQDLWIFRTLTHPRPWWRDPIWKERTEKTFYSLLMVSSNAWFCLTAWNSNVSKLINEPIESFALADWFHLWVQGGGLSLLLDSMLDVGLMMLEWKQILPEKPTLADLIIMERNCNVVFMLKCFTVRPTGLLILQLNGDQGSSSMH